jgi:uncharacterized protein
MRCPICRKTLLADTSHRPFCSKRCADADLANWLGGNYRIPVDEKPDGNPENDPE